MEKSVTTTAYGIRFEVTLDVYSSIHPDDCGEVNLLSICVDETEDNLVELLADSVVDTIQLAAEEALSFDEMTAA